MSSLKLAAHIKACVLNSPHCEQLGEERFRILKMIKWAISWISSVKSDLWDRNSNNNEENVSHTSPWEPYVLLSLLIFHHHWEGFLTNFSWFFKAKLQNRWDTEANTEAK